MQPSCHAVQQAGDQYANIALPNPPARLVELCEAITDREDVQWSPFQIPDDTNEINSGSDKMHNNELSNNTASESGESTPK